MTSALPETGHIESRPPGVRSLLSCCAALSRGGLLNCFLGLAATRVWLQCILFGSYTQSDDGLFTIVSNFAYGAVMLVGAFAAWKRPFSECGQKSVAWAGFALMTVSTLAVMAGKETGLDGMLFAACIVAGMGGALGGAMWTVAYVRLSMHQAVLFGFLSLALGSLGGLVVGFLPEMLGYTVSLFMPPVALLCYQRALRVDVGSQVAPLPVYDEEPRSTILFIFGGIAVFGLALGLSRGFPAGEPVVFDPVLRVVHQVGVIVLSLFVIWWAVLRCKRLSFSFLWRIEIFVAAGGMLILSAFPGTLTGLAIATVNIADTFMLGVLWVTMQDVSRHTTVHPYAVYGFAWATRIFSRNIGRVLIIAVGVVSPAVTTVVGVVMFALAVSMAFLLSDGIPRVRALFDESGGVLEDEGDRPLPSPSTSSGSQLEEHVADARVVSDETLKSFAPMSHEEFEQAAETLRNRYGLSEREMQIALLIAQGRSKAHIADQLFVTENTVRTHAKNAYAKLGVHSKQDLIDLFEAQLPV